MILNLLSEVSKFMPLLFITLPLGIRPYYNSVNHSHKLKLVIGQRNSLKSFMKTTVLKIVIFKNMPDHGRNIDAGR